MAFLIDGLYQVGPGGNSPRTWTYSTLDNIAAVSASGYFDEASDLLNIRDVITVMDTATPTSSIHNVLTNAAGVVDVSGGLVIPE